MARKKPLSRKKRTRAHVIADLSANHVERHALLCGYSVERRVHDYGIDLAVSTYDRNGEVENGLVMMQVKATDHMKRIRDGEVIAVRISPSHLMHWLLEPFPVILIIYDALANVGYWLYIQAYFERHRRTIDPGETSTLLTLHIPRSHVLDEGAMRIFAEYRDRLLASWKGVIHYD